MNRHLGLQLARARKAAGLSQAGVAERMGTTQSAIARAEAGRTAPTTAFLERFARAVGRPIRLTFGAPASEDRRARLRAALGDFRFDPWARDPSPAEARALEAQGLTRDRRAGA